MRARLAESTILLLIAGHLANAPRAQKEAGALRRAGARVVVRGAWSSRELAIEDRALAEELDVEFAPVVSLIGSLPAGFAARSRLRLARELFERANMFSPSALGLGTTRYLRAAREINADLTIVHFEGGLWVGAELLERGHRVGVDFEDWFSEDLVATDRVGRPVEALRSLEGSLLRTAHCCFTTTEALSAALAHGAGASRPPTVVPNCFPAAARRAGADPMGDPRTADGARLHWFSQTIGPGRGLETLGQALLDLPGEWSLSLRGSVSGYEDWFERAFPKRVRSRIELLGRVANRELMSRIMSHDVGLALEVPYCSSRDLTASNKIFEYLRAGLAVVATRTRGQEEVMRKCPNAGTLVEPENPGALAAALGQMVSDRDHLARCRRASLEAGETIWSWETYEPVFLAAVERALA